MIATLVYIRVQPEHLEEFVEASRLNHENSILEKGNLRFDIIRQSDDMTSFVFYEVFENEEAIAAHKQAAHYLQWRHTVDGWMANPRSGVKYEVLFPKDRERW